MGIDHSNPYIHSTTVLCDNRSPGVSAARIDLPTWGAEPDAQLCNDAAVNLQLTGKNLYFNM